MAFKMKNAGGTFKTMGSSPSPMKSAFKAVEGDNDAHVQAANAEKAAKAKAEERWSGGNDKASKNTGRSLDDLVKTRKGLEKGSSEYNAIQNEINKSLGDSTRHDQDRKTKIGEGDDKMVITKKGGEGSDDTNIKTSDGKIKIRDGEVKGGEKKAAAEAPVAEAPVAEESKGKGKGKGKIKDAINKVKGKVKGVVDKVKGTVPISTTNRSTYDPKTGKGSSGLGMETTTGNKKGNKRTTTHSMGTDTKKDDKVTKTKIGKNKQTHKSTNADLHSGGVGTSKTKHYTKGKKAGTSETKERQKGKLFGKKVEVDYS
tara:strand:- start:37 stop:978 length:942 start_codon:yes stop_codon:yes gene_type:complete